MTLVKPPPQNTVTCLGFPALTALVTLLEMSRATTTAAGYPGAKDDAAATTANEVAAATDPGDRAGSAVAPDPCGVHRAYVEVKQADGWRLRRAPRGRRQTEGLADWRRKVVPRKWLAARVSGLAGASGQTMGTRSCR
jgi:hypothetical protein